MAFKSMKDYNEAKFANLFLLRNDGDYADVIFMYRSADDALVADTHYIKSADYTGYVHCTGRGCPACSKGIRVQTKLFIPLYNIDAQEIQFWDRTMRFENQLMDQVFSKYPNPSEYVFRVTRHGAAGDINTTYDIVGIGRNVYNPYGQILADNHASFPEYYSTICKEYSSGDLYALLNTTSDSTTSASSDLPDYQVTPRVSSAVSESNKFAPPDIGAADFGCSDSAPFDLDSGEIGESPDF